MLPNSFCPFQWQRLIPELETPEEETNLRQSSSWDFSINIFTEIVRY